MAALNRPTRATYEAHESIKVDTQDNEDHTFCGVLFPIKAKEGLPVEHLMIRSLAVRGELGPLGVWRSEIVRPQNGTHHFSLDPRHWTRIYEATHEASPQAYVPLELDPPVQLRPGEVCAFYVHSSLEESDQAIVYDNSYTRDGVRYKDDFLAIHTGKAHLSTEPFGQFPIWGWGNSWRDFREFVGQVEYGVRFTLWNPPVHHRFGPQWKKAVLALLSCRRLNPHLGRLPDECIYYILHMCKWNWFNDTTQELFRQRRRQIAAAEEEANDAMEDDNEVAGNEVAAMEEDNNDADYQVADNEEEEEEMWEHANGYRADTNHLLFRDLEVVDEPDVESDAEQQRNLFRQHFARAHILRALGLMEDETT